MKREALIFVITLLGFQALAQSDEGANQWKLERAKGRQIVLGMLFEEAYLHTSKPFYYAGETVWFKAYMKYRTPRLADSLSKVLYVELIDADKKVILTRTLRIENGQSTGEIMIPVNQTAGNYTIRAYTNWMRNYGSSAFYTQPLPILDKYDLIEEDQKLKSAPSNQVSVAFDQSRYSTRDKIGISLTLKDAQSGNLSVSVTNLVYNPPVPWAKDIRNEYGAPEDIKVLDSHSIYRLEKGVTWVGKFSPEKKRSRPTSITFIGYGFDEVQRATPTKDGRLALYDLTFNGAMPYNYLASNGKEKVAGAMSEMTPGPAVIDSELPVAKMTLTKKDTDQRILTQFELDHSDTTGVQQLSIAGSVVAQSGGDATYETTNPYMRGRVSKYGARTSVVTSEEIQQAGGSIADAIRLKIPGYRYYFARDHWWFFNVRGGGTPSLLIQGRRANIPITQTVGDWLLQSPTTDIDHVIVNPFSSSVNGNSSGTIDVYYKIFGPDPVPVSAVVVKGFETSLAFNSPLYDGASNNPAADLRTTLYWSADVRSNTEGVANFSFYASDLPGTYRVVVEGMTADGKPVHCEQLFEVVERR